MLDSIEIFRVVAVAGCHKEGFPFFLCRQGEVLSLVVGERHDQVFNLVADGSVARHEVGVDVIYYRCLDIWISLQHIEEHGSSAHEGFDIRHVLPFIKVSW